MYIWATEVSRSIHEGKWLAIKYENQSGEETSFWIAINDIRPLTRSLTVDVYNVSKSPAYSQGYKIYLDRIKQAFVLEGSYHDKQEHLINKITENPDEYDFLSSIDFEDKVLKYYLECYNYDNEPYQTNYTMIEGIDMDSFEDGVLLQMTDEVYENSLRTLQAQLNLKVKNNAIYERIVLNHLSIYSPAKGIIPIAFHSVLVDIKNKQLVKETVLEFSPKSIVFSSDNKVLLQNYTDVDFEHFKATFEDKREEYIESIKANLSFNEKVDQRPYFMKIATRYSISIKDEYGSIQNKLKSDGTDALTAGLISFFGKKIDETKPGKKSIIVDNDKINVNQMRTVFNAINRDVLYVQGPPGTGKTVSIVNIIHSSLFNDQTVLVTTNNNEAVDNIFEKINKLKFNGIQIRYPYLRLGSDLHIAETLNRVASNIAYFEQLDEKVTLEELRRVKSKLREMMAPSTQLISDFENKLDAEKRIEILNQLITVVNEDPSLDETQKASQTIDLEAQIQKYQQELPDYDIDETVLQKIVFDSDLVKEYLYCESLQHGKALLASKNRSLLEVLKMSEKKERLKEFKKLIKTDDGFDMLTECFPIIASTNISVLKIGNPNKLFDLLIMEEASQCSTGVALVPMNRCRRACFIGDPNQLQPVVNISDERNQLLRNVYRVPDSYDYRAYSILNTLLRIDGISKFILLKKHYRCAKKIVSFSNKKYYNEQLEIETVEPPHEPLKLITVENSGSNKKNTSHSEVNAILNELRVSDTSQEIAVITPFRNQVQLIRDELTKNGYNHIPVDTVYGFQGKEKDKIIFSGAISEGTGNGTFDWIKNNKELINVMSTRPRNELVVVADVDRVRELSGNEMNDFYEFITYVEMNGNSVVTHKENDAFDSRVTGFKHYSTDSETEFLKTIAQLKSTTQKFSVETKARVADVLDLHKVRERDRELFSYAIKAHFDFVLYDHTKRPLLAVEICGDEHFSDPAVMANDLKKVKVCLEHNMKIIPILNADVRRYIEIKKAIINTLTN